MLVSSSTKHGFQRQVQSVAVHHDLDVDAARVFVVGLAGGNGGYLSGWELSAGECSVVSYLDDCWN